MEPLQEHEVPQYEFKELLLHADKVDYTPEGSETPILKGVIGTVYNVTQVDHVRGQVVALLGPSGVGKTTLFRIMAGLLTPTSGMVRLDGRECPVVAGEMGVVSQNYYVLPHRTVLDNLLVAGRQAGLSAKEAKEKAIGLLTEFDLVDRAKHFPKQLSGGQRQRVAIAQQLMCSENFLLMDEPFSGLDPVMKDKVCQLILKVANMDERNTIIVVTHDIHTAISIADQVWLMGRDRTPEGEIIPGARIVDSFNLIDMGLAWRDDVQSDPVFHTFVTQLANRFKTL